jgi:peptidoglycan/LPS O-acetylase OafA/YrhL
VEETRDMGHRPRVSPRAIKAGSAVLLVAAVLGTLNAWIAYELLCDENCDARRWELTAQLIAACLGLACAAMMTYFAFTGRRKAAAGSLTAGVLFYGAMALFEDAATHGWGNGPIPF